MPPQHAVRATLNPPPWPPDDTAESVTGSEYHQHVIDAARDGLRLAARANRATWRALSHVPLAGFQRPDGSAYTMLPDVFVHPRPNPRPASEVALTIGELGVPLLAIEVLSESTYEQDIDEVHGKAWSYADAGVGAYLIVDYDRRYIDEYVRALRLENGRWARWEPNAEGRWESAALGVSFEFDGLYLRVRDAAGRLKPLPDEADALLEERDALLGQREAQLARIQALARAGDWAAIQALFPAGSSDEIPNP